MDLSDVGTIEKRFQALQTTSIRSPLELEAWFLEESRFLMELSEAMMGHYVGYCQNTADLELRERHLHDERVVKPLVERYERQLSDFALNHPLIDSISNGFARLVSLKRQRTRVDSTANYELASREGELIARHNRLKAQLTVHWDGLPHTVHQMRMHASSSERNTRQRAWLAIKQARHTIRDELDDVMDELIRLRHQMALNAGFRNYLDYQFAKKNRDYSIFENRQFHDVVESQIIPVLRNHVQTRQLGLGLTSCRPWDRSFLKESGVSEPLQLDEDGLCEGVLRMLTRLDKDIATLFRTMRMSGLVDLGARLHKTGTFMAPMHTSRTSFLQMNACWQDSDIMTLIHELGHCFHNHQYRHINYLTYRRPPQEVAELASIGLEYLILDKLDEFYPSKAPFEAAVSARILHGLESIALSSMLDKFQHWLYKNPEHTRQERQQTYLSLIQRFTHVECELTGFEDEVGYEWQEFPHLYVVPLYMIEYAIAELGAIQLWEAYQCHGQVALERYKAALQLGNTKSVREVYRALGLDFDFSADGVKKCVRRLAMLPSLGGMQHLM